MLLFEARKALKMRVKRLQLKKARSQNIERQQVPWMKTMKTCHLSHPYWRRRLRQQTRSGEELSLNVPRASRAKHVVFVQEEEAVRNLTLSELLVIAQVLGMT